jgi:hypothetical protein
LAVTAGRRESGDIYELDKILPADRVVTKSPYRSPGSKEMLEILRFYKQVSLNRDALFNRHCFKG